MSGLEICRRCGNPKAFHRWGECRGEPEPRRARRGHPEEITVGGIRRAVAEVTRGSRVHDQAAEAISEAQALADAYELERGHRPGPYAHQQRGVTDDFEDFVHERRERERAAREAEDDARMRARHNEQLSIDREVHERRAEIATVLYMEALFSR